MGKYVRKPPELHKKPGPPKGTPRPPRKSLDPAPVPQPATGHIGRPASYELPVEPRIVMGDTLLEERVKPYVSPPARNFQPITDAQPADRVARNWLLAMSTCAVVVLVWMLLG
jgi:hypothetical protein